MVRPEMKIKTGDTVEILKGPEQMIGLFLVVVSVLWEDSIFIAYCHAIGARTVFHFDSLYAGDLRVIPR